MESQRVSKVNQGAPIYVVSGGTGATGELLVRTVLAQFTQVDVPIIIHPHVSAISDLDAIVAQAGTTAGCIVHTLVNESARAHLIERAAQAGVFAVDMAGPLVTYLAGTLGQPALGQPGLYRKLHSAYFERVEAIEFTVAHDDGQRIDGLTRADMVLVGVSRVGKTPLSMFLSILGWKVANVPFVAAIPLPDELFQADQRRVVGLMIEPLQLMTHRRWRQQRTGIPEGTYVARDEIVGELRAANHFFYQHHIPVVDTTDKPIETSADEVVQLVTSRLHHDHPQ
ncbi:MAG: kinase/pyrophosphorylase [Caldilineaceae bacterium]|nr:kinase/pyrophosphorylase [Caldilineaceae bacterium]